MDKLEKKSYTISQISKMLDIPIDSIRYFEKEGVIQPHIDEKNSYRKFSSWDISMLLEYKDYRSMGFSMTDVMNIQKNYDLDTLVGEMEIQHRKIEETKRYYSLLEERLEEKKKKLESVPRRLNQIYRRRIDEQNYIVYRDEQAYQDISKKECNLKNWRNYFPFVDFMMCFSDVKENMKEMKYIAGYSITKKWADAIEMPNSKCANNLPACEAICTVISSSGRGPMKREKVEPILSYLKEADIPFSGKIYGNMLARTNEKDGYCKYIELFVPIQ